MLAQGCLGRVRRVVGQQAAHQRLRISQIARSRQRLDVGGGRPDRILPLGPPDHLGVPDSRRQWPLLDDPVELHRHLRIGQRDHRVGVALHLQQRFEHLVPHGSLPRIARRELIVELHIAGAVPQRPVERGDVRRRTAARAVGHHPLLRPVAAFAQGVQRRRVVFAES